MHIPAAEGESFLYLPTLPDGHLEDKAQCKQGNYNKPGLAKAVLFLNLFQLLEEACKTLS